MAAMASVGVVLAKTDRQRSETWCLALASLFCGIVGAIIAFDDFSASMAAEDDNAATFMEVLAILFGYQAVPAARDRYRLAYGPAVVGLAIGFLWLGLVFLEVTARAMLIVFE